MTRIKWGIGWGSLDIASTPVVVINSVIYNLRRKKNNLRFGRGQSWGMRHLMITKMSDLCHIKTKIKV